MSRREELYSDLDNYLAVKTRLRPLEEKPVEQKTEAEGWWSRVRKRFEKTDEFEEVPAEEAPVPEEKQDNDAVNDMKEVSRIALSVLQKMNSDQVREFKSTADYDRFKTLLRKYQLIK